ncbi:MAG: biopolymer transporter ExbD [Pseudomonadota bacterium]
MINRRRSARRQLEATELNITAFMNLMVILVPFLLITAVFSQTAILELNLPGASSEPAESPEQTLQLEITVREARIEVGDRNGGVLSIIDNVDGEYNLTQLGEKLREVKSINPDKFDCTLLLESDISYETLVQVMDTVRIYELVQDDELKRFELFPDISIGDATALSGGA